MLKCHRASVNHVNILWNIKNNHFVRPWGVSHDDLKNHWGSQGQMGKNQRSTVKKKKQNHLGTFLVVQWLRVFPCRGWVFNLPWGVPKWCVVSPKKQNTNPSVCVLRDASRKRGLSLPCHAEVQKLLKSHFFHVPWSPLPVVSPLPSETSCFSCSDKKLAGRWLNKNPHTPGLSVS